MSLWYNITINKLKFKKKKVELLEEDNILNFSPSNVGKTPYELKLSYKSGKTITKKSFFGSRTKDEVICVKENLKFSDITIEVLSPPEEGKEIRNIGTGAVIGALVAGPVGLAAGAWLGTKLKNVEIKITIPSLNFVCLGHVATGFLASLEKAKTSTELDDSWN